MVWGSRPPVDFPSAAAAPPGAAAAGHGDPPSLVVSPCGCRAGKALEPHQHVGVASFVFKCRLGDCCVCCC